MKVAPPTPRESSEMPGVRSISRQSAPVLRSLLVSAPSGARRCNLSRWCATRWCDCNSHGRATCRCIPRSGPIRPRKITRSSTLGPSCLYSMGCREARPESSFARATVYLTDIGCSIPTWFWFDLRPPSCGLLPGTEGTLMDESIAERAARIASRGVGSALAAERNAEFRIKAAEWHLHQLVEIGERLAVADRQRQNGRDDPVIETMNAMIDVPVRNALGCRCPWASGTRSDRRPIRTQGDVMSEREGAFGHVADAVMLAAEAEEHHMLALAHLAAAQHQWGISTGLHAAGYFVEAIGTVPVQAGLHRTAEGLHADAAAIARSSAGHAAAAAHHAGAVAHALGGGESDAPPPQ